ncbi:MAG: hypothetical protein ACT4QF_02490 [Sporichthyaceae bacterium]
MNSTRSSGRARYATAALAASLAGALLAGCGSAGKVSLEAADPIAVSSTPSPSVMPTPTPADEQAAILAQYREFFARQAEISLAPKEQRKAMLEPFTTNPALQRVLGGMFAAEEFGEVGYGAPVVDPTVQSIEGDTATVHDCQDGRGAGRKKRDTGKITTRGMDDTKVVATLKRGEDGLWRMATVEFPEEPC